MEIFKNIPGRDFKIRTYTQNNIIFNNWKIGKNPSVTFFFFKSKNYFYTEK